jgi:hypothetical protein
LEGVADLSAVPAAFAVVLIELFDGKVHYLFLVDLKGLFVRAFAALLFDYPETLDVHLPDVSGLVEVEWGVIEFKVNS